MLSLAKLQRENWYTRQTNQLRRETTESTKVKDKLLNKRLLVCPGSVQLITLCFMWAKAIDSIQCALVGLHTSQYYRGDG